MDFPQRPDRQNALNIRQKMGKKDQPLQRPQILGTRRLQTNSISPPRLGNIPDSSSDVGKYSLYGVVYLERWQSLNHRSEEQKCVASLSRSGTQTTNPVETVQNLDG